MNERKGNEMHTADAALGEATAPIRISAQKGRLHFLDFLRGLAALVVMFGHATNENGWLKSLSPFLHQGLDTGRLGVTTFFIVSGFVIPLTLERRGSIRAFVINRFFRLYPLYWLSIIIVLIWLVIGIPMDGGYYGNFARHMVRNVLANITMFQEFVRIPNAIPVYWTLTVELAFYGLCIVLFRLDILKRSLAIAWAVLTLVLLASVLLPVLSHHRMPFEHVFAFVAFFVGMAVYRNHEGKLSTPDVLRLAGGAMFVALVGVICNYYIFTDTSEAIGPVAAFLAYCAAFLLFFAAYANRSYRYPDVFLWLGRISYSAYLLHSLVIELAVGLFGENARMLVGIPATLAVSTLTYRYLEAPAVAVGHRLASRYKSAGRSLGAPLANSVSNAGSP